MTIPILNDARRWWQRILPPMLVACVIMLCCATKSSATVLAAPTLTPDAAVSVSPVSVSISWSGGATIHFTVDGTTPTAGLATYGTALRLTERTLLQAIAVQSGFTDSPVASGTTFDGPTQVAITADPRAVIHVTTDGSPATVDSPVYTGPINVTHSQTINAIAVMNGAESSKTTTWPAPASNPGAPHIKLELPATSVP